ncbi:uncharacterized protein LOC126685803 [Mercurialis annua]|uniref:uncharacterized protein LOC126685803 n=1 Tax=Mercurialis annua TaxID=3986 RepID=UPI0021602D31|nr:uncharacterized protein LOC126685803 [Mercurialis annua]
MALSLSSTILIISLSVFVLAGDAMRDMPEEVSMTNMELSNVTHGTRLGTLVKVANYKRILVKFHWSGECFRDTTGWWSKNWDLSVGWLMTETTNAKSYTCSDSYEFRAGNQVIATDTFYTRVTNPHETMFFPTEEQKREIRANGIGVYLRRSSVTKDDKNEHDLLHQVVETI